MARASYSRDRLVEALAEVGLETGDTVFSHVSLLNLGVPEEMRAGQSPVDVVHAAVRDVIGPEGTFLTPSYTYSFCRNEPFDARHTPSTVGSFSEALRTRPSFRRSLDPIFSVVGEGPTVPDLFRDLPPSSFGAGSLNRRMWERNVKVCNIGVDLFYLTPIHALERSLGVPYRFDKNFRGEIRGPGGATETEWEYYVRVLAAETAPNCRPLQDEALRLGLARQRRVGAGTVTCTEMAPYFELAARCVREDPWFLTAGPALRRDQLDEMRS